MCVLKGLCSRRIVGWATGGRMTSRLAVDALDDVA
ncbi:transposase InsO family protein [Canibacter oris]|uniref:Transposase InsO family protein n=1 Tax=Canibacter oris TaxID=1365628 RepID=A0A840DFC9_9MICO|nr:transposase InsO family protein [Canibacter oris]